MAVGEAKRLPELEAENKKPKKLAETMLEKTALSAHSKVAEPATRRRVVAFWVREGLLSEWHGCRLSEGTDQRFATSLSYSA